MSRLYLILLFSGLSFFTNAQNLLPKYLKYADEQMQKGDYVNAILHYEKAMEIDSNTVDIIWNMAEAQRAYKDYRKAEYYYQKVYQKESSKLFSNCLLYLGLMQKQNGKYSQAIETFKKAKKLYSKEKKAYPYLKAKHELESTLWAKDKEEDYQLIDMSRLPEPINSVNAEFGHAIVNDKIYFSSLRGEKINAQEEVYDLQYKNQIFESELLHPEKTKILFEENEHTGNGTFSLNSNRFYYSVCTSNNGQMNCKIAVREVRNGKFGEEDILGEIINSPEASNTTMPHIANIDGKEVLFFASNRKDSEGGLDIYYTEIKNGQSYSKVKAIKTINSIEDEITPFWDSKENRLYFSSTWNMNYGGMDVFYSKYENGQFTNPENAGLPINSSANDIYYFKNDSSAYISSNRMGVLYAKNPTCCTDIFRLNQPTFYVPPTPVETFAQLNKRLPVTLYFQNDEPNPKTTDSTTTLNYLTTYENYIVLEETYKKEYQQGLKGEAAQFAIEDIEDFFLEHVQKGKNDLNLFTDLLLEELKSGKTIRLTVRGFASPLANTAYNVQLTKRRIASLINYFKEWKSGEFLVYLKNNKLIVDQIPFGEYNANQLISDNPNDKKQSIYSRAAALERKIEINGISTDENFNTTDLILSSPIYDAGKQKTGTVIHATYEFDNKSNQEVELELEYKHPSIEAPANLLIAPIKKTKVAVQYNTTGNFGHSVKQIVYINKKTKERFILNVTSVLQ